MPIEHWQLQSEWVRVSSWEVTSSSSPTVAHVTEIRWEVIDRRAVHTTSITRRKNQFAKCSGWLRPMSWATWITERFQGTRDSFPCIRTGLSVRRVDWWCGSRHRTFLTPFLGIKHKIFTNVWTCSNRFGTVICWGVCIPSILEGQICWKYTSNSQSGPGKHDYEPTGMGDIHPSRATLEPRPRLA
jgi:hypothetical protein